MRHIISLLLENQVGALSRVIGLFSQRGYNIESLTVSPTDDETLSRLNITTETNDMQLEQMQKQLHKLIDVLKVQQVSEHSYIERELMMVKVKALDSQRAEVKRMVDIFRGQIIDVTKQHYTIQLVGASDKLSSFLMTIADFTDITEVARSGVVGIARGEKGFNAKS